MSAAGAEGWLLGIEVGGTKLQLGIGRADGSLAALERLERQSGAVPRAFSTRSRLPSVRCCIG